MSQTKTMVVIPKDLLEALRYNQRQQMGPVGERIVNLDQEIRSILNQENISDVEKAQQYFQTLEKFAAAKELIPAKVKSTTSKAKTPIDFLNDVPNTYQNRAQKIFHWLSRAAPDINWNEKGEVSGIPGSNIADLVTELTKPKTASEPVGFPQFAELLQQANIPRSLVSNSKQWDTYLAQPPTFEDDDIYMGPPQISSATPRKEADIYGTPPATPKRITRSYSQSTHRRSPSTQVWLKNKKSY